MLRRFMIGGHRGVGENVWKEGSIPSPSAIIPHYRENTIESFIKAAALGVDFVEFDVQVTRDGVPVIWHDDTVLQVNDKDASSAEVKDLTLQQFKSLVHSVGDSSSLLTTSLARQFRGSKSRENVEEPLLPWSCLNDDVLPSLEEVYQAIPTSCGFDIEIKMTLDDDVAETPRTEIDRVVDATLDAVQRMQVAGGRRIFFSSFDPDVCESVRKKQQSYEVWFLSGCGLYSHVDPRRTSITTALQFAKENNLSGVVLPAKVLLANEYMVSQALSLGLGVMTYGLENDDQMAVNRQKDLGVYGAIVDDVQGCALDTLSL